MSNRPGRRNAVGHGRLLRRSVGVEALDGAQRTAGLPEEEPKATKPFRARLYDLPYRNELLLLIGMLVGVTLLPRSLPVGSYATGVVAAALFTLSAVAIVLIFRINRFINFAQLAIGGLCATIFGGLVQGQFLLRVVGTVCGCVGLEPTGAPVVINYVVALVLALATGPAVSWALYLLLLRRFEKAPRLMPTVMTVFVAQALVRFTQTLSQNLVPPDTDQDVLDTRRLSPPIDFEWQIGSFATFHLADLLAVLLAVVAVVGLSLYLRRSDTGIAIRAASENSARAETLGVNVPGVTSRVWLFTGGLAALAGVLATMGAHAASFGGADAQTTGIGVDELAMLLFVGVVARFTSLPMVAFAAVVVGVVRSGVTFSFGTPALFDAMLALLVCGILLTQRSKRETRAEREDATGFDMTREPRRIPKELRNLPQVKRWVRYGVGLGVILALGLPWVLTNAQTGYYTTFIILSIVGLSLVVVTGWGGQVSFGQMAFAAIGAWAATVSGWPFPLAVVLAGGVGAAAAVIVAVPALRLRGLNLSITTLAFAVSAHVVFIRDRYLGRLLPDTVQRPTLLGMHFDDVRFRYYFCLVMVALVVFGIMGLRRTRTGRAIIAVRANEPTGQSFGINVVRVRVTAFAIGGFLAGIAGALLVFHAGEVDQLAFEPAASIRIFLITVIGGAGGIAGPLLGVAYETNLRYFGAENPLISFLGEGLGGIMVLLAAPGGLAAVAYGVRDSALRRLAIRLRIPVPALMGDRAAFSVLDRAQLDPERTAAGRRRPSLRYKLPQQWALGRFGEADRSAESIAVRPVERVSS